MCVCVCVCVCVFTAQDVGKDNDATAVLDLAPDSKEKEDQFVMWNSECVHCVQSCVAFACRGLQGAWCV